MRRKDREVTGIENIAAILERCDIARIGLSNNNRPYIVPMNFVFQLEGGQLTLFFHCAREGRKMDMLKKNPHVCFEADCSYKTVDAEKACNMSAEYESVIGEGLLEIVEKKAVKTAALQLLVRRYGFQGTPVLDEKMLGFTTVLRLSVTDITGKRKQ